MWAQIGQTFGWLRTISKFLSVGSLAVGGGDVLSLPNKKALGKKTGVATGIRGGVFTKPLPCCFLWGNREGMQESMGGGKRSTNTFKRAPCGRT